MNKRLVDLNPKFFGNGGEGVTNLAGEPVPRREGCALVCDCPCGCDQRLVVPFKNPIDGGPVIEPKGWDRTGDTFETLTLSPSIQRVGGCAWHGFIRNGEIVNA